MTWKERRAAEVEGLGRDRDPYVVVIGGGQGGIALGARLRQLGVDHVVVDRHARPGDQWRSRYKSLCLHDPVWYDHLPYLPFPPNWPVFAPKDKIGDWLEMYTRVMEINYWGSTTAKDATWDDAKKEWTVTVDRDGEEVVLHPKQLVFALGVSGKPNIPSLPGQDVFRGEQHHSSQHPGPDAYKDKRVVVIGSNNSAFDICGALWEVGADVTMVQRSSTHIVKSDSLMEIGLGDLYSESALAAGVTTFKADTIFASLPYRIMHEFQIPLYEADGASATRTSTSGWRPSGFRHDWGDDGSGLFMKYLRRGSGYYIDVGAADLVANGDIPVKQGQVDRAHRDRRQARQRRGAARRPRRVRHRLRLDERPGRRHRRPGDRRQGRQGLGPRLRHHQGPRPLGGRAAQHVEAHPAGGALVPRRQPAPVPLLLALPRAAAQGPRGGDPDARSTGSRRCTTRRRFATTRAGRLTSQGWNDPRGAVRQPKSA